MIGSEQKAAEHSPADHSAELEDRADDQRRGKTDDDDPRQFVVKPAPRQRKGVEHELKANGDGRQDHRHRQRLDREFGAQRQPSQEAARPRSRDRPKGQVNGPAAEGQTRRVDAAAQVVRHRSLVERVEPVAVGDADRDRRDQQPREEAEVPAGVAGGRPGATLRRRCRTVRRRRNALRVPGISVCANGSFLPEREFGSGPPFGNRSRSTRRTSPAVQAAGALILGGRRGGRSKTPVRCAYAPGAGASATAASVVSSRKVKVSCR